MSSLLALQGVARIARANRDVGPWYPPPGIWIFCAFAFPVANALNYWPPVARSTIRLTIRKRARRCAEKRVTGEVLASKSVLLRCQWVQLPTIPEQISARTAA